MLDDIRTNSVHKKKLRRTKMQTWLEDLVALLSLAGITWVALLWGAILDLS